MRAEALGKSESRKQLPDMPLTWPARLWLCMCRQLRVAPRIGRYALLFDEFTRSGLRMNPVCGQWNAFADHLDAVAHRIHPIAHRANLVPRTNESHPGMGFVKHLVAFI